MEQVVSHSQGRKIWVDGNTLVEKVGAEEVDNYLYGKGYQAQLTKFIRKREAALAKAAYEQEQRRNKRLEQEQRRRERDAERAQKEVALEPGAEE